MQLVLLLAEYESIPQSVQGPVPGAGLYLPARQATHKSFAAVQPALHMQLMDDSQELPTPHCAHSPDPELALYLPGAQAVQ